MKVKVMKFGGTSVASEESRKRSAGIVISAKDQGWLPVVVVSAIGRKGDPFATDTLISALNGIDPQIAPDPREMDLMIACGEIFSAVIFAHTLKSLGHQAQAFRGGQAGIRTDGVFGNARITSINPQSLVEAINQGFIPVVCGFQGTHVPKPGVPGGELTTLGRGGSDTTAAALGAALRAEAVEIYTDVDGVKTADPDSVPDAPTLRQISYEEVAEIAHLGAKVLHPRAAEIAMKFGIPMWVKSTFSGDPGTKIVTREEFPGRRVTGITHTGKLVYLDFDLSELVGEARTEVTSIIYDTMARYELNLYMMNHGPSGFGFATPREQYPIAENLLDGLVVPTRSTGSPMNIVQIGTSKSKEAEVQEVIMSKHGSVGSIRVNLTENCTMISMIGHEYLQQPGVFFDVLKALHDAQIGVLQTSDSELSLSCLVPEVETDRAVRVLHDRFELSKVS